MGALRHIVNETQLRAAGFAWPLEGQPGGPVRAESMQRTRFVDCDLSGSVWGNGSLSTVRFVRCLFDGAEIEDSS